MERVKVLTEQEAEELNVASELDLRHKTGDILYSVQPHAKVDIDLGDADVTLEMSEVYCSYLEIADGIGSTKSIIYPVAPPDGFIVLVKNGDSDTACTVKVKGETGATAAANSVTVMMSNGEDMVALGKLA